MTRPEAEQIRDRLSATHPDRTTHSFILSERDGEWTVAKVALPPSANPGSGVPTSKEPSTLHEHEDGRLPGGIPNWTGGV